MDKDDLKSFYVAVLLSAIIVLGMNYMFPKKQPQQVATDSAAEEVVTTEATAAENAAATTAEETEPVYADLAKTLAQDVRLPIKNEKISGSIRLKGARFDEILLTKYKQTVEDNSPAVELFAPAKTEGAFFAQYGWLSSDKSLVLPTAETLWQVEEQKELTDKAPVTLFWRNGQGLKFKYIISLDENYLFNVKQVVENNSGHAVSLIPYGLISKHASDDNMSGGIVHQGVSAIFDGKLKEIPYGKIDEKSESFETTGGWAALSDKYWFGAFIFNEAFQAKVNLRKIGDKTFQLDFKGLPLEIQSGASGAVETELYAGAKEIKLLDKYAEKISKFDLTVDFGWYYFLTKPFFYILDYFYHLLGNMGWAIILFAALLRLLLFPLANKSYENMSKMKKLQPKLVVLQEQYADDKMALQRATMELYKREKVNPAAGCLPMFIQIPIFFSLYKVLVISLEIRHAPFIGWVKDLSAPDPLIISEWAHIWVPAAIDIGVWPIIYGVTMILQNRLNPKPANKDQARMFALMPFIFMIMFAHFAVGLVIYWTLSNILSMIQQKIIMYKNGVK